MASITIQMCPNFWNSSLHESGRPSTKRLKTCKPPTSVKARKIRNSRYSTVRSTARNSRNGMRWLRRRGAARGSPLRGSVLFRFADGFQQVLGAERFGELILQRPDGLDEPALVDR